MNEFYTNMKIKVTNEIKEVEGEIVSKPVMPFGTSAHINVSRKHIGKIVDVVISSSPKYTWVLSDVELDELIDIANKSLDKREGRLSFAIRNALKSLSSRTFDIDELLLIIGLIQEDKSAKNNPLILKIDRFYRSS